MSRASQAHFRPRRRRRQFIGGLFAFLCFLATLTGVIVLTVLLGSILWKALAPLPNPPWYQIGDQARELFGYLSRISDQFGSRNPARAGYKAGIAGSLWLLGLVALLSIPIGVAAGVYLEEYARPGRLRWLIGTNLANLAGIPSIVYGILGLVAFSRAFGVESLALGKSLWAGAMTLSLLVLPTVVIATREGLRAVPSSLRQAALGLGATRWQMIRDHVIPAAMPGILTGTILALSRAIGETAPLLMVGAAASVRWTPRGPGDLYTALPVEIYNYASEAKADFQVLASGGILILLVLLLSMNAVALLLRNRYAPNNR